MKIAIAGAGALGSRFGFVLQQAGNDVTLIDGWPAHVAAIKEHGLKVTLDKDTYTTQIPVMFPKEVTQDMAMDLIIVFTKSMQLDQMLQDIKPIIKDHTKILCLLNGIGH
jgi:Ketopantoate reductase